MLRYPILPNLFRYTRSPFLLAACWLLTVFSTAAFAAGTTVPISASLATGIATDMFPVTVKLDRGNLFLTNPKALFLADGRIGMQVRIQAYDHRPADGIAISEIGIGVFSGTLGFDADKRQILVGDPRLDKLAFVDNNAATQHFMQSIKSAWATQVTNPLRADIPPHPYVVPFKNNIRNLAYDGQNIILTLAYDQ
jgi:hypothetical protein